MQDQRVKDVRHTLRVYAIWHTVCHMAHTQSLNAEIAGNVRATLAERGVSQTELSTLTPIAERTLRRRMTGDSPWTTDELAWVSDALQVPVLALLKGPSHAA